MEESGVLSEFLVFLLLGMLGGTLLSLTRNHRATLAYQFRLFFAAYALRFVMAVAIYAFGLVNVIKDEDGSGWVIGIAFQRRWLELGYGLFDLPKIVLEAYSNSHRGYYYLLGALFSVIEPGRLAAAALNCFFGAFTIVFAYRTARTLFDEWVARRVGLWLCVFPSMVLWSSQTIKEPAVILLEVVAVYGCVHLRRAGLSVRHVLLTLACIVVVIPFRFYAAYLLTAAVVISCLFPASGERRTGAGPILGAAFIALILVSSGLLAGREVEIERFDLEYITRIKKYSSKHEGSGVDMSYDLNSPSGLGLSLLVGGLYLLLAPFPWQLAAGSLRMLLVGPEMVYWWWIFFRGFLPGIRFCLRQRFRDVVPLLVMLLGFGLLYSLMFSNVGLVYRQRAQLMPWMLTFAGVGLELRRLRRKPPTPIPLLNRRDSLWGPSAPWSSPANLLQPLADTPAPTSHTSLPPGLRGTIG